MDTDKHVAPPITFGFYQSAKHVTSQVLQPKALNKWYRGATRLSVSIVDIMVISFQTSAVTCLAWPSQGPLIIGLADGKVRAAFVKNNKVDYCTLP